MDACLDPFLQGFISVLRAPGVRGRDPEHLDRKQFRFAIKSLLNYLVRRVLSKSWKPLLLAVSAHVGIISPVSLLDSCNRKVLQPLLDKALVLTSIVGDVLALGVDPVELLVDSLRRVVPVLPDDALGLVQELVLTK